MATMSQSASVASRDWRDKLRGGGPLGLAALLVILLGAAVGPLVSAPLILLWAWLARLPWRELGFVRPKSWAATVSLAVVGGALFKLALKALVMPLLGADPVNRAFHFLAHNPAALPGMLFAVIVSAGFGEEMFFRAYLFERLGKLLGGSAVAKAAIIVFTAALFGVVHLPVQGLDGAVQATIVGLVLGTFYAASGRIVPVMIAHASFDLAALAIIYFDVESKVAHALLR